MGSTAIIHKEYLNLLLITIFFNITVMLDGTIRNNDF